MASTIRSRTFDAFATTTNDAIHKSGAVIESVFESTPTLKMLRGSGFKEVVDGLDKMRVNVMTGKNTGISSYDGLEPVNVDTMDGMTAAFFDMPSYSGPLSISGKEKSRNQGKAQIVNLITEKNKQLAMSFQEKINQDLWDCTNSAASTGNSGKNIISIPNLVSLVPNVGVVGLIDRATASNAFWRNKMKDATAATTFVKFKHMITNFGNTCGRGAGGSPDHWVGDQISWEVYHNSMQEQVRYAAGDTAKIGFEHVMIGGAKFFWDTYVPDAKNISNGGPDVSLTKGTIYALNSNFMHFACLKGRDFTSTEFVRPANQVGSTSLMLLDAQLYVSSMRKHGVIHNIAAAISA